MSSTHITRKALKHVSRFGKLLQVRDKPILVLDFDGVICDSREECMLVVWHGAQGHPVEALSR